MFAACHKQQLVMYRTYAMCWLCQEKLCVLVEGQLKDGGTMGCDRESTPSGPMFAIHAERSWMATMPETAPRRK
jgi:hypothetical protein